MRCESLKADGVPRTRPRRVCRQAPRSCPATPSARSTSTPSRPASTLPTRRASSGRCTRGSASRCRGTRARAASCPSEARRHRELRRPQSTPHPPHTRPCSRCLLEVHASSPAGRCDLVFGAPIEAQCATPGEPSESEVAAAHATYIAALKALAGRQKGAARLGCGGVTGTSTLLGALRGTQGAAWLRRPRAARGVRRPAGPVVRREAARVAHVYRHARYAGTVPCTVLVVSRC